MINAMRLTDRTFDRPNWSATAPEPPELPVSSLVKSLGFTSENVILCDTKGVVYKGRAKA